MIDFSLTPEQQALRDMAADLATRLVGPVAADVRANGGDPWPRCAPVFDTFGRVGITGLLLPTADGGGGGSCVDLVLVLEELAAADIAIAANLANLPATMGLMLARAGGRPYAEGVVGGRPRLIAGALNEADVSAADIASPVSGPGIGLTTQAARTDDGAWRLNGRKVGFVTNGGIADGYVVVARTQDGPEAFWVPATTPGVSHGNRTELAGWPTGRHGEIVLDDVRLAADARMGLAGTVLAGTPEMAIGLAACFVGLARASYVDALGYARERRSWGRPIIEHQAVALKLAAMRQRLQSARLVVWQAAWAADGGRLVSADRPGPTEAATVLAPMAKAAAVDAAIEMCGCAVEIHGGSGVAAGSSAAQRLADAWVGYSCDFTRELLLLQSVPFL